MAWSGITSAQLYSAGNAIPVTNIGDELISVTVKRPASGEDVIVTFYADGAPIHTMTTSATDPIKTSSFSAPGATALNYSTDRAFASPGASISASTEASTPTSTPSGDVAVAGAVLVGTAQQPVKTALPRRVRLAKAGHSITNFLTPTTVCDCEAVSGVIPASTNSNYAYDGRDVGHLWLSHDYHMVADGGVGGQTIQQFLDRSDDTYSDGRKSVYDILSTRPDIIWFDCLVNDVIAMTLSTTDADVDALIAKAKLAVTLLASGGAYVITPGCIAYSGNTGELGALQERAVVRMQDAFRVWCPTQPKIIYAETVGLVSSAGRYIDGYSDDGTHPNDLCGAVLGRLWDEIVGGLYTVNDPSRLIYDTNKDWSTVVSNRPTGVASPTVTNSATLQTASTVDGVWRQPFTCPATNCTLYFEWSTLRAALVAAGAVTGDAIHTEWDIEILNSDGTPYDGAQVSVFDQLYNTTNAGSFSNVLGDHRVGRSRVKLSVPPVALDRDAADLGTTTRTRVTVKTLAVGSFILVVYPPKLRKYVPLA